MGVDFVHHVERHGVYGLQRKNEANSADRFLSAARASNRHQRLTCELKFDVGASFERGFRFLEKQTTNATRYRSEDLAEGVAYLVECLHERL